MNDTKEIKMFNHGVFQEYLQNKMEYLKELESKEKDPYKKWNIQDQLKLCEELFQSYKTSVETQLK